jgi:integrase
VKAKSNKKALTEFGVRQAKASGNRAALIWDTKCPGLTLSVQPSGHRAFRFFYSFAGRKRWYHLGPVYLSDARRIAHKLRAAIAEGRDPVAERRSSLPKPTFAEVHQRYLEEYAKQRNKSWKQADALIKRNVLPAWGRKDITSITRADARALMSKLSAKAPVMANQTLAAASAVLTWAVKQEIVTLNVCRGVEANATASRDRVLSDAEIRMMWPLFSAPLRVLLLCGQRKSEVSGMRWEHVTFNSEVNVAWWDLPGAPIPAMKWPGVKNKRSHRVPLSEAVRELILEHNVTNSRPPQHGFVWGKVPGELHKEMARICKQLGVERATPHDLRRTFSSTVTRLGYGLDAMDRLLNHSKKSKTTVTYDRYKYEREDRAIMEHVAQYLTGIVEGRDGDNVVRGRF